MAGQRLSDLVRIRRKSIGLTQGQLATYAKVGRPWLSRVETESIEQPDRDALARIATILRVPAESLLAAAGYPVSPLPMPPPRSVSDLLREALAREQENERVVLVPVAENATASAGMGGAGDETVAYLPIPEHRNHDFTAIRVVGECMEPEIRAGDIAIVDRTADPQVGDIVVANVDGDVHVKRLRGRNSHQFLEANQPGYPSVTLGPGSRIIGVVRWSGRAH